MAICEMLIPDEKKKCSRNFPKRNPSGEWLSRMKWRRSPSSYVRMKHPSSPARIIPWMAVFLIYEANVSVPRFVLWKRIKSKSQKLDRGQPNETAPLFDAGPEGRSETDRGIPAISRKNLA